MEKSNQNILKLLEKIDERLSKIEFNSKNDLTNQTTIQSPIPTTSQNELHTINSREFVFSDKINEQFLDSKNKENFFPVVFKEIRYPNPFKGEDRMEKKVRGNREPSSRECNTGVREKRELSNGFKLPISMKLKKLKAPIFEYYKHFFRDKERIQKENRRPKNELEVNLPRESTRKKT
jgi:hypothetical protein